MRWIRAHHQGAKTPRLGRRETTAGDKTKPRAKIFRLQYCGYAIPFVETDPKQGNLRARRLAPGCCRIFSETMSRHTERALVWLLLILVIPSEARAYTDPGSGALIWQILVAAFVGGDRKSVV